MHTLKCMAYAWRPTNSYYSLVAIQAPVLLSQEKVHARVAVPIKAHVLLVSLQTFQEVAMSVLDISFCDPCERLID